MSKERIAEDLRNRLKQLEVAYLKAKEYLRSGEFANAKVSAYESISHVVSFGKIDRDDALLAIGRIQQIMIDTHRHEEIIIEYEGIRDQLAEAFPPTEK